MVNLKPKVRPKTCAYHDKDKYTFEIELPGVQKDRIQVEATEDGFTVWAEKKDVVFTECYCLSNAINPDASKGSYNQGLLSLELPLKNPINGGRKIKIS